MSKQSAYKLFNFKFQQEFNYNGFHIYTSDMKRAIIISLHHKMVNMNGYRSWFKGYCTTTRTVVLQKGETTSAHC